MAPNKIIINVCPTGMVATKEQNPHLPVSPSEIIDTVLSCADFGASVFHLHARDEDGAPTWKKEVYAKIIEGIRAQNDSLVLIVSTSGRGWGDLERRADCLELEADLKPDMASLTLGSMNFPSGESVNSPETIERLASCMMERGIKPELDVFEPGMVHTASHLIESGLVDGAAPYFNFILGSLGTSPLEPSILAAMKSMIPDGANWSIGGIGRAQLRANIAALAFGGGVRVGLEDNLYFNKGTGELATNEKLVKRIVSIATAMDIRLASAEEARERLGLKPGSKPGSKPGDQPDGQPLSKSVGQPLSKPRNEKRLNLA